MLSQLQHDLATEWQVLQTDWELAQERWCDGASERFAREFWAEWDSSVPELLNALQEIDEMSEIALRSTE